MYTAHCGAWVSRNFPLSRSSLGLTIPTCVRIPGRTSQIFSRRILHRWGLGIATWEFSKQKDFTSEFNFPIGMEWDGCTQPRYANMGMQTRWCYNIFGKVPQHKINSYPSVIKHSKWKSSVHAVDGKIIELNGLFSHDQRVPCWLASPGAWWNPQDFPGSFNGPHDVPQGTRFCGKICGFPIEFPLKPSQWTMVHPMHLLSCLAKCRTVQWWATAWHESPRTPAIEWTFGDCG